MKKLFTSESVTEGHPDKVCDFVSDSILDALLRQDPASRVACETCATTDYLMIMGEVTTTATVDYEAVAREAIRAIGYDRAEYCFDDSCRIEVKLHTQSPDIAMGVNRSFEAKSGDSDAYDAVGAGDQGMMFGYATDETEELMPIAIMLSHRLTERLSAVRKDGTLSYLRPDGKAQVTVEYDGEFPLRADTVVVSTQHDPDIDQAQIRADILEHVIRPVIPTAFLDEQTKIYVNPTGSFVLGGPAGDSGLTGRKIIVDTYGGSCPHGGGAFSGKDPTKVDRSASYMARYICKNVVASGLARRCRLQLSYSIGVARPISINIDTEYTGVLPDSVIADIVAKEFDLRPLAIMDKLGLTQPIYTKTTNYGHFGKADLPWERTDMAQVLKTYLPQERTIASFTVDHTTLKAGLYTSRIDGDAYTYDLRFVAPSSGAFLSNAVMHTVEHQFATVLRNGDAAQKVLYFGPMGCRTGFYLVARNMSFAQAKALIVEACERLIASERVTGASEKECGNCREHDLAGAKSACEAYLRVLASL